MPPRQAALHQPTLVDVSDLATENPGALRFSCAVTDRVDEMAHDPANPEKCSYSSGTCRRRATVDAAQPPEVLLISCATCGNAAFVEITAAPGGGRPSAQHWRARCTECGQEWNFTDPE